MGSEVAEIRTAVVEAVRMMFDLGIMQHSGHGNVSARLDDERMLLTGKGNLEDLTKEAIATVALEGEVLEGEVDPVVAEIVPMHAAVYRERAEVGAVIHNHAPNATAFALAHAPLPCAYEALLRFGVPEEIPVADWAPRGSEESVRNILKQMRRSPKTPAVLLANHGVLAFGRDPVGTARLLAAIEEAAEAAVRASMLGGVRPFPPGALERERGRTEV